MCQKCKKNSCTGCGSGNNTASMEAQFAELQETVESLAALAAPFLKGHPIIILEHADDIAQFDLSTGKGSGDYALYAVCDGKTHKSIRDSKNIVTPNLIDRFIVAAGGGYAVDDTGGFDTIALAVSELPSHSHAITDPGHTHGLTDPGHDHPITDPGHNHAASSGAHTHGFTTDVGGAHDHTNQDTYQDDQTNVAQDVVSGMTVGSSSELTRNVNSDGSTHTHSGTTDAASGSVTVDPAFTGIDVTDSFTGMSVNDASTGITATENEGDGDAHENRPPFYAVLMVMLIG